MESLASQNEQAVDTPKGFLINLLGGDGRAWRLVRESGILGALIVLIVVGAIRPQHPFDPSTMLRGAFAQDTA